MKKIIILCFIAVSTILEVKSQTYYVDAEYGDDIYPGSISQPWQHLDTAINRLKPGNVLHIRAGNYTSAGKIQLQKNATSDKPIVIGGYQDEYPKVQGFNIINSSWLTIEKIDFSGPLTLPSGWKDMDTVVIDRSATIEPNMPWDETESNAPPYRVDSVLAKYSTYSAFFNYNRNTGTTWESISSAGLNLNHCSNLTIRNNRIHHHTYGIQPENESTEILIDNNEIHHCLDGISAYYNTLYYNYSFGYSTISNNTIYQSFRNGIMLNYGANHNLIDNNIVKYSGQNHISTFNLDVMSDSAGYNIISNNAVAYGGYYAEFMHYPGPSAISMHSPGPGCKVIGNYIAYQIDATLRDGNSLISDNNPNGSEFINNVSYRVMGSGINITFSVNNKIIHNTIIEAGFNTGSLKNGVSVRIVDEKDNANIIANNIFCNAQNGGILAESGNMESQAYIDHNLYFFDNGARIAANGLSDQYLFDAIPFLGFEANGIMANPLIDSLGHIYDSSPAIGHGTSKYSYPVDKQGTSRDTIQPTIGAYEKSIVVGINEIQYHNKNIRVFPNPAGSILVVEAIDINHPEQLKFNIYTIKGTLVFSEILESSKMNFIRLGEVPPGIYIYKYGDHSGKIIKR